MFRSRMLPWFRRLPALLRAEQGMAIWTVLWVMVIALGLSIAAATASSLTQSGTVRDKAQTTAISAADAAANIAVRRYNKVQTTTSLPCLVVSGGLLVAGAASGDGWCPQETGSVGGATWTYRAKPAYPIAGNQSELDVIATGTYNGQTRRIKVAAVSPSSTAIFGGHAVSSLNDLTMGGGSRVNGSGASNANVILGGNSVLCGDIQHGVNGDLIRNGGGQQCAGYVNQAGTLNLAPVDQGNAATVNSNGRFFSQDLKTGSVTWNAAARALKLGGAGSLSSSLTLGGTIYSLCTLDMSSNSSLYVAAGAQVKIFFDSPEACGLSNNTTQLKLSGGSTIAPTSLDPTSAQFYFLGSDAETTKIDMSGNSVMNFTMFAPRTDISLSGNNIGGGLAISGAIAGKSVSLQGNATVSYSSSSDTVQVTVIPLYFRNAYVECRGATGSPPDSGC